MAKTIIFRADGNAKSGLGHIYRLVALAAIVEEHYKFLFLTSRTSIVSIIPSKYDIHYIAEGIDNEGEPNWISLIYSSKDYFIIADGYSFDSNYQRNLKSEGFTVVYIDDLVQGHYYADLIINHSIRANIEEYHAEDYTQFALGTDYVLLRKEFLEAAKLKREMPKSNNALVCFGGSDPLNLTGKALAALVQFSEFNKIHVILGQANKQVEVNKIKKEFPEKVCLYKDLNSKELIGIFKSCKLAIVPSSTILYEISCIGMTTISGYYSNNQKETYEGFLVANAIIGAGNIVNFTKKDFNSIIESSIKESLLEYNSIQNEIIDGYSDRRLLRKLHILNLSFRIAQPEDIDLVYSLSNDPLVRKNSFNSDFINKENHQIWYNQFLGKKGSVIYIAEVNGITAGMIRYKNDKDSKIVGVVVGDKFRGFGLASELLKQTSKYTFEEGNTKITAYIKSSNKASIRSFENANYKFVKNINFNNISSAVYELEKKHFRQ